MKPKAPQPSSQDDLFRSRLDQILNRKHPLFALANQINWEVFYVKIVPLSSEKKGRPGKLTRLMVGLHYLKNAFNESDESVVAGLLENPYWQYLCGFELFINRLPVDPTSMTRWLKRIGPEDMEQLLSETLATAKRENHLTERHMERVNVDTTVQEKAIAYPTDSRLYHKARVLLVKAAKDRGIPLRQSYLTVAAEELPGPCVLNILHNNPFDGHFLKGALQQNEVPCRLGGRERLLRQRLQGQPETIWQHRCPPGQPAQEEHETERMALVQTTKRH